jgi:hypothetical protein
MVMMGEASGARFWTPRLMVGAVLLCGVWNQPISADEVLTLTGDNPNVGFVDNVGIAQNWQILGNDTGFQVRDLTSGTLRPFFIQSEARTDSLVVDNLGRVGLGTGSPQRELHLAQSGATTIRMEGLAFNSVPAQTYDVRAGFFGFLLTDLTADDNGSINPFVIKPGAPGDSLFVAPNGSVGIGTGDPNNTGAVTGVGKFFNVRADGGSAATGVCNGVFQGTFGAQNHLVHLNGPVNQKIMRLQCSSGFFGLHVLNDTVTTKAVSDVISIKMANGNVGLKVQNPAHPLQLASGAHVTSGGVFTNASSRDVKNRIRPITSDQARETVRALQPVGYRYNEEPDEDYVGFIAEDVPELVATKDRKSLAPMDVVAVLTKVVQDQDRKLEEQRAINQALMERLAKLEQKLAE